MSDSLAVRILMLASVGALVATTGDLVHVHTGTLAYPDPFVMGQAWWVSPVFLMAFTSMALGYRILARYATRIGVASSISRSRGHWSAWVETLVAFWLVYLLSGFGQGEPVLMSCLFYASFLARWAFSYERAWLMLMAVLMALGGMFAEGLMGHIGMVAYQHRDVFHVPWWLGGLYMHGAFALREGMRCFAPDAEEDVRRP